MGPCVCSCVCEHVSMYICEHTCVYLCVCVFVWCACVSVCDCVYLSVCDVFMLNYTSEHYSAGGLYTWASGVIWLSTHCSVHISLHEVVSTPVSQVVFFLLVAHSRVVLSFQLAVVEQGCGCDYPDPVVPCWSVSFLMRDLPELSCPVTRWTGMSQKVVVQQCVPSGALTQTAFSLRDRGREWEPNPCVLSG